MKASLAASGGVGARAAFVIRLSATPLVEVLLAQRRGLI